MTRRRTSSSGSSAAFSFVLTMGAVNLFSDMTYEAGGAMNGQFMASLGATAAVISITAGLGEFLGYSLRSVAGWAADRTGRYWAITFFGYVINLLAVPAMALAGNWQVAALLIFAERVGRAICKPTVEAMLSYTTARHGKGWVYAVNTALDETGATLGPLVVAAVLFLRGDYRVAYALLLVPAVLALAALMAARVRYPVPAQLEEGQTASGGFSAAYFLYMSGAACFGAGLLSYELVAYHLAASRTASELWIPLLLALATGCGVIASLVLGKAYDKAPLATLLTAVVLSSLFAPLLSWSEGSLGRSLRPCSSASVMRRRTRCSRPWWPAPFPRAGATSPSGCSIRDTVLAGWSAASPWACCMTIPEPGWWSSPWQRNLPRCRCSSRPRGVRLSGVGRRVYSHDFATMLYRW